jgi:hypothetical protein
MTKEEKEELVTINKSELDDLIKRLARVEYAADKARVERFDSKSRKNIIPVISLRTFNGKIIVGWKMIEDIVEKDTDGSYYEKQTIELTYSDGKTEKMPYLKFGKNYKKIPCTLVSKTEMMSEKDIATKGHFVFTLETPDGEKIEVGDLYVN